MCGTENSIKSCSHLMSLIPVNVVDRHRTFGADSDQTVNFDADPYQGPTPSLSHVEKSEYFTIFIHFIPVTVYIVYLSRLRRRCHSFHSFNISDILSKFLWKKLFTL
jgi:hypothetical protein